MGEDLRSTRSAAPAGSRSTVSSPARPERTAILMATVDALAEPYQILGLVDAAMAAPTGIVPTARLMDLLADQAAAIGGDAVLGIRLSQLTIPGSSSVGWFGRVIEHRANTVVAVAIGTAIRRQGTNSACSSRSRR